MGHNDAFYKQQTDAALTALVKEGDAAACEFLLEKYKYLVRQVTAPYYLVGSDREDLLQEGMIGLTNAIYSYKSERNVLFPVFAEFCIKRHIISAVKAATRQKHMPLNSYVSIFSPDDTSAEETSELMEKLPQSPDPENILIEKESRQLLEKMLEERLSPMELEVLNEFLKGKSYAEIAEALDKDFKSIDNALQRIKKKIRGSLE